MTRLQTKGSPCECGKTTKAVESFVTKTKFYETRSSDRKSRSFFVERGKRSTNGEKYYHRQLYFKKAVNSHSKSPTKEHQRSFSSSDSENRNRKSLVQRQTSLNGMITNKIEIGHLDSPFASNNGIVLKEKLVDSSDVAINGNGIAPAEELQAALALHIVQNGDNGNDHVFTADGFKEETVPIVQPLDKEEVLHEISGGEEDESNDTFYDADEHLNGSCCEDSGSSTPLKKKRKVRKSKFESLLECTSDLKLSLSEKRSRKRPENFSPPLNKRKSFKLDNGSVMIQNDTTLSGKPKKKGGRKPKYKGPVSHYLDAYIKDKSDQCQQQEDCGKPKLSLTSPNLIKSKEVNVNVKTDNAHSKTLSSTSSSNLSTEIDIKNNRKPKLKSSVATKKPVKLYSKEFDSAIYSVLGQRVVNGKNELLVLFENGTSNWVVEEVEGTALFDQLDTFYEHEEQDISSLHRISYNHMQEIKKKNIDSVSSSSSDCESDDGNSFTHEDDVFFNTIKNQTKHHPPLPVNTILNTTETSHQPLLDSLNDIKSEFQDGYADQLNEDSYRFSTNDLNELCNFVMSSGHVKLYPYETTKEIVSKVEGEFVHIYLKRFNKKIMEQGKLVDSHINIKTCENLITILEDCAINSFCNVVVISGIEEFFTWNGVFDKLLKKSALLEGKKYEHDIAIIRYLVQTIKNFTKPIAAVIKRTAVGLPASILSLFDMVFDEKRIMNNGKSQTKKSRLLNSSPRTLRRACKQQSSADESSATSDYESIDTFQNYVFPRLMGLTHRNEAQIMGEQSKIISPIDNEFDDDTYCSKALSDRLRNSVKHMKSNSRIRLKLNSRSKSCDSESDMDNFDSESGLCMSRQNSELSQGQMEDLEHQVEDERKLTKKYMQELSSLLKDLEPRC